MNSLVKVFSNFKEFYNEINGATLTGAIDVIVVEQPNGDYMCSPFHVRFGKLGVLRSREKVVDIEINGEPVDIHMKLGESGEAFFVEECPEEDVEELPDNLATSPIPSGYFPKKYNDADDSNDANIGDTAKNAKDELPLPLPLPRRNSIDFSKEAYKDNENEQKFENQVSDYSFRRHTDNTLERRNFAEKLKEYTTQKLRQEWAEHDEIFQFDTIEKEKLWMNSTQNEKPSAEINIPSNVEVEKEKEVRKEPQVTVKDPLLDENLEKKDETVLNEVNNTISERNNPNNANQTQTGISRDENKGSKKKRRKKTQMKKKNAARKSSSSSSLGSNGTLEGTTNSTNVAVTQNIEGETVEAAVSISNNSSNEDEATTATATAATAPTTSTKSCEQASGPLVTANADDESPISDIAAEITSCKTLPATSPPTRVLDIDIHFFSDTEISLPAIGSGPGSHRAAGRPSTPVQSDSELEISFREKNVDVSSNSASWKWGELPTPEATEGKDGVAGVGQAQRNSMLSGMFNFMRKTNKIRSKQATDAGGIYLSDLDPEDMDPEMAALYFPTQAQIKETSPVDIPITKAPSHDDDRESGNGTSLPHSPSSMEGRKSVDSDYDDGVKLQDGKYLDFVAMSLCGANEKGVPSDEEFDKHLIKYSDVCENPSLFASPNLYVRLNGKYYSWAAACPIVMTIITFQKPLTDDAIEQLVKHTKPDSVVNISDTKIEAEVTGAQAKRSWWYWRRSQVGTQAQTGPNKIPSPTKIDKDADQTAVATQTTRPNSPDVSENTLSKTDSTLNAENTSAQVDNLEDLSQGSLHSENTKNGQSKNERFKKSLRLSSDAIKKLNLKDGANEIEFSVTTAYQGTTRCKCYLFRWKHNDKVVISDIDGTITKSDVLGHILPMVGNKWAQLGVAQLFSKIELNGYKLLYLSARAIGQSRATREYLRSIRQGDVQLPDGPLLLNPTSLISAFHREVIERKPEQFKIACLSDIRDLFPNKDPFYAGYGNRINDVWAYRAVGIPTMRIFTINTKGELKHELTQTFQSSYCSMAYIVDQLFPPINQLVDDGAIEYSSFNYWRDPIPEMEIDASFGSATATTNNNSLNAETAPTLTESLKDK